jgi:two-component sensor histidine kinase
VALAADANQQVTLRIADDGVGFPPGLDLSQTRTLGLKLVCSLAQQLGGAAEFDEGPGTVCRVIFEAKRP